jgi:hypothetical protein
MGHCEVIKMMGQYLRMRRYWPISLCTSQTTSAVRELLQSLAWPLRSIARTHQM